MPSPRSAPKKAIVWAALGLCLLWPAGARADAMSDEAFNSILLLLSAVGAGYVLTHVAIERLSRRYIVVADVQYVLLGIVLGPLLGIIDTKVTHDIGPVLALGAGALGMLAGLELRTAATKVMRAWGPSIAIILATAVFVTGLPLLALRVLGYDLVAEDAWTGAIIAAGMVALSTTDGTVRMMAAFLGARGLVHERAAAVANMIKALATLGFGLLFALLPNTPELQMRTPIVALEAFGIQVAAGVALGLLFAASVYRKLDDRVLLTVLVGTIFLAAGIAATTHVSAIFVSFVAGVVFSRASRRVVEVTAMLSGIQRPFIIALFFFAGLQWVTGPLWTFAFVIPYLVLRWAGRRVGGIIGRRLTFPRQDYAAAVMPAGGLTVAFMLTLLMSYEDVPGMRASYGALLVAVILTEFGALRSIRHFLIDVDDVPPERRDQRGGFDSGTRG